MLQTATAMRICHKYPSFSTISTWNGHRTSGRSTRTACMQSSSKLKVAWCSFGYPRCSFQAFIQLAVPVSLSLSNWSCGCFPPRLGYIKFHLDYKAQARPKNSRKLCAQHVGLILGEGTVRGSMPGWGRCIYKNYLFFLLPESFSRISRKSSREKSFLSLCKNPTVLLMICNACHIPRLAPGLIL